MRRTSDSPRTSRRLLPQRQAEVLDGELRRHRRLLVIYEGEPDSVGYLIVLDTGERVRTSVSRRLDLRIRSRT